MSDDQDPDSKTEEPSGKKLSEARAKGQVVKSQEFTHLFMLASMLVLLMMLLPGSFARINAALVPFVERPHAFSVDPAALGDMLIALLIELAIALVMPMALLLIAGVLATVVQVGWVFSTEQVFSFNLERFNIVTNLLNKFKAKNLIEFAKSCAKVAIVSAVLGPALWPLMGSVEHFIGMPMGALVLETRDISVQIIFTVLMVVAAMAAADWWYQRYDFMQNMRMTKQEVKDEYKQAEGDPLVKNKIRQLRLQRAQNRMMENVPKADVVVTNPTHYAVALKYDPGAMGAPTVIAKGVDFMAQRIREVAIEHQVPIIPNPPLARALYAAAEVNEEVPEEHYKAVAQIISYVFKLKRRAIQPTS
ncbi:MAG TPA: flagellar biosynthesis protein FlhB [Azospirillaceae bacterium]|nr:flagellar biosynthesis protein FlhB [Azospirillaceae bacterium]